MAKAKRIQNVSLDLIDIRMDRNVREQDATSYDDPAMRDSLALVGQQTIAKLLKVGDRYEPIQGNRRVYNLKKLAAEGVFDPKTGRRDEAGNVIRDDKGKPIGAKAFEYIEAEVYEGLSERERVELLVDHGTVRSLNRAELFYAGEMLFSAGYSEKEVVILLYGLLAQHYPPTRNIKPTSEDGGKDALEYYRGVVQTMKDAWRAPVIVRDEWVIKLKTGRAWPIKSEMVQAYKTYREELDADKLGKINRDNPGPKLLAYWQKVVDKHQAAQDAGEKRGKSSASMNRQQITDKIPVIDSRILKAAYRIILREISEDQLPVLDKLVKDLEAGEVDRVRMGEILDSIFMAGDGEGNPAVEAPGTEALALTNASEPTV